MGERFFVEHPISGGSAQVTGQEAAHLTRVLRARVGDQTILFDGTGREFLARIIRVDRHCVECALLEHRSCDRESPRTVELAVALPKGDRQRFLVEKLVELGTAALTPLVTQHTVVQPDQKVVARLERFVIEASKQCGRNRLMAIRAPARLDAFLASMDPTALRLIAHPISHPEPAAGEPPRFTPSDLCGTPWKGLVVAVGPEGGFAPAEMERAARMGWRAIDLGPRWLRIETAAIAVAALASLAQGPTPSASQGTHA